MKGRQYDYFLRNVPASMQDGAFAELAETITTPLENLVGEFREAGELHLPLECNVGALPYIGDERRLPKYKGETDQQYRQRLWDAWSSWEQAGTDRGIIRNLLLGTGITEVIIKNNVDWDPEPPDGDTDWWSRFWVLVYNPNWESWTYGSGEVFGETEYTYGSTATRGEVDSALRLVLKWKPAAAKFMRMYVFFRSFTEVGHPGIEFGDGGDFSEPHAEWNPEVLLPAREVF